MPDFPIVTSDRDRREREGLISSDNQICTGCDVSHSQLRPPIKRSRTLAFGKAPLFVLIVALYLLLPSTVSGAEPIKRVLILSSEDITIPGIAIPDQIIRSTLRNGSAVRVQFYTEAQDSLRISNDKYEDEMVQLLRRKYEGEKIDLIFALGPPVLRFLLKHRGNLFPATPVVFLVMDLGRIADLTLGSNVTGVGGTAELRPTLDIALALDPGINRVVVVAGNAPLDQALMAMAREEFRAYEGRINFTNLTNITIQDAKRELASLLPKTVVFYLSTALDAAGNSYPGPEAISIVAPSSSAPIYGLTEPELGNGIVGGRLMSFKAVGARAAEIGLRILAGERPHDISPQTVENVSMFDWRELHRWGLSERLLPAGSIVRFKELTFWEQYSWRIIGAIALCGLEALLVFVLLVERRRRGRAGAALRETERRFRAVFESTGIGIALVGIDARIIECNPALEKMLGYSADELRTRTFAEFTADGDVLLDWSLHIELAEGKRGQYQIEKSYRRKDGSIVWGKLTASLVQDLENRPLYGVAIVEDITMRKLAEEALGASEDRYRELVENANDIIFSQDLKGNCTSINKAGESITGYNREEALKMNFSEIIAPQHLEGARQIIADKLAGDKETVYDLEIIAKDGQCLAVEVNPKLILQDGVPIAIQGIARDVTERRQAEQTLRESEERFRVLADTAPVMVWLSGENKLCQFFNRPWLEFTGKTMEQERGEGWIEGVHPDNLKEFLETYNQAFDERRNFRMEYRLRRFDGEYRWVLDSGVPRYGSTGTFIGYIGSCIEITERRQAEEQLRATGEQLRAFSASLQSAREEEGARIARELHDELGAALTSLKWDLASIENLWSQAGGHAASSRLRDKIEGMTALIDATTNAVIRISSELRPAILDDLGLVDAIEWQARQVEARTGITCQIDSFVKSVDLSREKTTAAFRILQEAMTNVIRHAQATRVNITMGEEKGEFVLEVRDNGRGVTGEEKTSSRSLGLTGIRERAHLVGGTTEITGFAGKGTVLTLRIPM